MWITLVYVQSWWERDCPSVQLQTWTQQRWVGLRWDDKRQELFYMFVKTKHWPLRKFFFIFFHSLSPSITNPWHIKQCILKTYTEGILTSSFSLTHISSSLFCPPSLPPSIPLSRFSLSENVHLCKKREPVTNGTCTKSTSNVAARRVRYCNAHSSQPVVRVKPNWLHFNYY